MLSNTNTKVYIHYSSTQKRFNLRTAIFSGFSKLVKNITAMLKNYGKTNVNIVIDIFRVGTTLSQPNRII